MLTLPLKTRILTISEHQSYMMLYQQIAEINPSIVEQAISHGLVDGTVLYADSTHLKANANKNKYDKAVVAKSRSDYWEALDTAITEERKERLPVEAETKVSRTDPDSGYMVRDGKPKGFFYLDDRAVNGRCGVITDTFATPANVHDSIVCLGRLDRQRERFGFPIDAKQLHGHRYVRFRERIRVACQCLLAAAAQNMKKIALALSRAPAPLPT